MIIKYISRDIIFAEIHIDLDKAKMIYTDFFLNDTEGKKYKIKFIVKERLKNREY